MIKQIIFILIATLVGYSSASASDTSFLSFKKTGKGTPMVLIHGMACSAEVWNEVAEHYKGKYELHIMSIAGFGNMQDFESPHILKSIRDELIDYVKRENLEGTLIMGHSMGGFISLWAAIEAPGLFSKIISVDGLPYFPVLVMPGITAETAGLIAEMMQNAMTSQTPEMARAGQEMMIATMIGNIEKRDKVMEMGMNSNPKVVAKAMGEMYTTDLRPYVNAIDIPVLALGSWYGYKNYGVTMESALMNYNSQFNAISQARVKMAETGLHFIFYDEPEWFFKVVDNFLEE